MLLWPYTTSDDELDPAATDDDVQEGTAALNTIIEQVAISIEIDDFCIQNDDFCIQNDESLRRNARLLTSTARSGSYAPASSPRKSAGPC